MDSTGAGWDQAASFCIDDDRICCFQSCVQDPVSWMINWLVG